MSLAELSSMVRCGEMSHREANERDGLYDDEIDYDEEEEEDDS